MALKSWEISVPKKKKEEKKKRGCTKPIDVDVEIREYSADVRGFACFGRGTCKCNAKR